MQIHTPDIYGPVSAAGAPGTAGQVLTSGGAGVQVGWSTPTDNSFTFASPSAISHVINHNLGNAFPAVTVWDSVASAVIEPATIISNTANQLTITFFAARAIAGTIVG